MLLFEFAGNFLTAVGVPGWPRQPSWAPRSPIKRTSSFTLKPLPQHEPPPGKGAQRGLG